MCELFALSSALPTTVDVSLRRLAAHGAPPGGSVDGWGVASYDGGDARLLKEPEPLGRSAWLAFMAERHQRSHLVLSHIRRATQGAVTLANTQPFARELGGRVHVFAHNGRLQGIEHALAGQWRRFRPLGETDSEIAFCVLLERLAPLWSDGAVPAIGERVAVVRRLAATLRELGPANFIYGDGELLVAHGHERMQADGRIAPPGLHWLSRRCAGDGDALPAAGVRIGADSGEQRVVLVASVPLTDEGWRPLAEGETLAFRAGALADDSVQSRQDSEERRP